MELSDLDLGERLIRADFLRQLVLDELPTQQTLHSLRSSGLILRGGVIKEELNLANVDIPFRLALENCRFLDQISFANSSFRHLSVNHSVFEERVLCSRLELRSDFTGVGAIFRRTLSLDLARIGGHLTLDDAQLLDGQFSLFADGLEVRGSLNARSLGETQFRSEGEFRFLQAIIGGNVSLLGATFENAGKVALSADRIRVAGNVQIKPCESRVPFTANGVLRFSGSKVVGQFEVAGASITGDGSKAIIAEAIEIGGKFLLQNHGEFLTEISGSVLLNNARIQKGIACAGIALISPGKIAFSADMAEIGSAVHFGPQNGRELEVQGEVRFGGTSIASQLVLVGAFSNPDGNSIFANSIQVAGDLIMGTEQGVTFLGTVILDRARISSALAFGNCRVESKSEKSISASSMEIGGDLAMGINPALGFQAIGWIDIQGSRIGGALRIAGAISGKRYSLFAQSISVKETVALGLRGLTTTFVGPIDLTCANMGEIFVWRGVHANDEVTLENAKVNTIALDSALTFSKWKVNGLTYNHFHKPTLDSVIMVEIVNKGYDGEFLPQPYRQLLRVLRESGNAHRATEVAIELGRSDVNNRIKLARKNAASKPWFKRLVFSSRRALELHIEKGLKWLVGYGYRPGRAITLGFLLVVSAIAFQHCVVAEEWDQLMVAKESEISRRPAYSPSMYVVDTFLPVVDFGQASNFWPRKQSDVKWLKLDGTRILRWIDWLLVAAGWLLSAVTVGALSGVLKRIEADR